jgi:uncharacterized membrane protein
MKTRNVLMMLGFGLAIIGAAIIFSYPSILVGVSPNEQTLATASVGMLFVGVVLIFVGLKAAYRHL